VGFSLGISVVLPLGAQARQDAWVAFLVAGAAGAGFVLLLSSLVHHLPRESLVGASRRLLGRYVGGLLGLLYVCYSAYIGSLVLRTFGDFVATVLLPESPLGAVILVMALLCAYSVRHGLEPFVRAVQILAPMVVGIVVLGSILVVNKMKPEQLLPVFEAGLPTVLRAAFTIFAISFGDLVLFAQVLPKVQPAAAIRRGLLRGVAATTAVLTAGRLVSTMVLGSHLIATASYPSLEVARAIEVADFITRLDVLLVAMWVGGGLTKAGLALWTTASGLAEWLGLRDYRPLVLPVMTILAAFALVVYEDTATGVRFPASVYPVFAFPFQVLIPLLLLGVAWLRRAAAPPAP